MQKLLILTLVLYGTLYTSLLVAGTEPANQLTLVNAGQDGCRVSVTLQEDGLVEVETAAGLYHAIQQEGMVPVAATGDPALQALAWTLEIPATSDLQYQLEYEVTLFENIDLIPEVLDSGSSVPEKLGDRWQQDSFYPSQLVTLSDPAIMRNHRLVQVTLTPYQYNPVRRQLRVYHNVELDFTFAGVNRINQLERTVPRSATFEKMLAQNVINYEEMNQNARDWDANLGLDPILYIYNSACQSVLDSLLWWKQERGHTVYTATQNDVTLTSYTSVKSYIQTAYDSWDNPPVFVVLVGDPTSCSFGTVAASNSYGDHDYSRLEGGDILADIFVGRMSVGSSSQLETVVHKQLSYESYPYVADPGWFNSAHLIGDDSLSGMSMVFTNENIRLKILGEGLTNVTTCYAYQGCNEVNSLIAAFNNGISFFNYRGWLGMSGWSSHSANELSNSHQLPFVVAITCGTGDYTSGTSISEDFYRAGSDSNPKGGVAAIGTATSGTHTRYNNAVDLGVFGGIFDQDQATGGEVMFQGKFELWQAYNSVDPGQVTNFSNWNNLIGDPSLELRVGTPLELEVTHPGELVSGASGYPVLVTKSGTPLPGILVCMHQHGGAQVKLLTNAAGEAILPLAGQFTGGTATLTVVAHNRYPYQQRMNIINQSFWVDSYGAIMDDDNNGGSSGNADGLLNPGEQIELTLQLINRGTSETATGVSASVNCADPRITVLQDNSTFPDIAPGATVSSNILYQFSLANLIDQEFPSTVLLEVDVTTSGGDFNTVLQLELVQPLLSPVLIETDPDGDDLISRGETGEIHLSLENRGTLATGTLNATLTTADPQVTIVTGTLTYGNIPPGGIVPNLTPFLVRPDGDIFNGHLAELTLTVTTPEGYQQMMTSSFNVGPLVTGDPLGPVEEYYCFDSGDTYYSQHPVYDWMEISGSGTVIPLTDNHDEGDDSYTLTLPFDFYYCGVRYTTITVCSNGWLAMGDQDENVNYRNYPIPTSIGPAAMIAPFWDDLRVNTSGVSGRVYYQYDLLNNRFIVEWYQLTQVGPGSPTETFEVILYDQDYLPSTNGDICFQYQSVTNNTNSSGSDNSYATVGIENPTQSAGIQYSYWNSYPTGAIPLQSGLALLFTQDPGFFSYDDHDPPAIVHTPPLIMEGNGPFTLSADLVDPSGVEEGALFWSLNGISFTETAMTQQGGDTWEGILPSQPLGTTVWYYFWARDAADDHNEATSATYTFINGNWEVYYSVDVEQGTEGWTHSSPDGWSDQWHISTEDYQSPTHSWKCGDSGAGVYLNLLDARLELPEMLINPYSELHFWHRMQAEVSGLYPDSAYDGGILEISDDGGNSWGLLLPSTGYNKSFRTSSGGGNPCTHPFAGSTPCYSGEFSWENAVFDLSAWTDQMVQIRFRFGSDQATGLEGWYVDDLLLQGLSLGEPQPLTIQIVYNAPYVTVSWDAVPQASGYRVYSSSDPFGGFVMVQESTLTSYSTLSTVDPLFFRVTWLD